jgi:transposase
MSLQDLDRYDVIRRLIAREMKQGQAASLLGLSIRQVKRLKNRVKCDGAKGLVHLLRGKAGNRRLPKEECQKIVQLVRDHYLDFSASFACEKLREVHDITHDPKTIRAILVREKVWKPARGKKKVQLHAWRERRPSLGELEQFDGSYHAWLEDRFTDEHGSHEICLLASIDDATGKITRGEFAAGEGVVPVFAFWRGYMETHGKPRDIYLDRFSTYRMNPKLLAEEPELKTQFERAMKELGVGLITAHTPQAKGRVERLFHTLQDRLVKELRLAGISTMNEANTFLRDVFLPKFNEQFSVVPREASDLHRSLTAKEQKTLSATFSIQHNRVIRHDFTISYKNVWYQILPTPGLTPRPKETLTVEERMDGTIHLCLRGKYLETKALPERPLPMRVKLGRPTLGSESPRTTRKPALTHPWRRRIHAGVLTARTP